MSRNYDIGKDIGKLQADVEALQGGHPTGCKCGRNANRQTRPQCTADDWRTVAVLSERSDDIYAAVDKALREIGISHVDGSPLYLASFVLSRQHAAPPRPNICACCGDGFYGWCGIPGCDPCEPVPITFG